MNETEVKMANAELCHHGILGQKWGVRRTPVQLGIRKSANSSDEKKSKSSGTSGSSSKKSSSGKSSTEKKELSKEDIAKKKEEILKSKSAKTLYENKNLFDDKELQTAYSRLVLENNVKNLTANEKTKGQQYVEKATKTFNQVGDLLNAGTKAYNGFARIYNSFSDDGKDAMKIIKDNEKK